MEDDPWKAFARVCPRFGSSLCLGWEVTVLGVLRTVSTGNCHVCLSMQGVFSFSEFTLELKQGVW